MRRGKQRLGGFDDVTGAFHIGPGGGTAGAVAVEDPAEALLDSDRE